MSVTGDSAEVPPPEGPGWNRRTFLKAGGLTVGGMSLGAFLAACGTSASGSGGTGSSSSGTLTLRLPFLQDMQVPDPDIMYEGEGLQVMDSCYEGLVNYKPGTSEIVPGLAKSWTVSADQLTYTFKLVPGVKFHDGTPADASAWVKSFDRRLKVNQGPAYMVEGVVKMAAPDATTFVVTLREPNNAFLHYAACPWQMFAVSPTAVAKHAKAGDLAQGWLQTHDAGTGPYVMSEFVRGSHYTLQAFDGYWGPKPTFKTVRIVITPSIATQKLQLDQGAFDLVTKGFAIPDVLSYKTNPQFSVTTAFGASVMVMWMNTSAGIFANVALRKAMMTALDRTAIVNSAFSGLTTVEQNFWPEDMFPAGLAPFSTDLNTAPLAAAVKNLPSKTVDMAYVTSYGAPAQQIAELCQAQLAPLGLNATIRAMPSAEEFDLVNQAPGKRPDLMIAGIGGDALHLDTAARIFLRTGAKPLNFFAYSNKTLDSLMDLAIQQPTEDKMNQIYLQMTKLIESEALWVPFCRTPYNLIAQKYISGLMLNSYIPEIFNPDKITRA
jgi:peptide/nickel transport system substrate-binding protein